MKEYTICKKCDWNDVKELETTEWLDPFSPEIRAFGKICYDEENLYVRLRAVEKDIRAENTDPLSEPCEDSCLEFFFSPDNTSDKYFNVEYNPNCLRYLGIATSIRDLVRLFPDNEKVYGFDPKVEYTADGWQITYHIPFAFIRLFFPDFAPRSGGYIMANVSTTGEKCSIPHTMAWSKVDPTVRCAFHNPKIFGKMWFE